MKINKKISIMLATSLLALFNGCASKDYSIIEEANECGAIKPVLSLEQTIKKISAEEGFTARIKNHTSTNPSVYAKDFIDLKNELDASNLDFEVHNYTDSMDTKRVTVFSKGDVYAVDKELIKKEYIAANTKYMSIGEMIKIFDKYQINLIVPSHLHSKVITLTPDGSYKLTDLVNELTNKLISMNIYSTVETRYEPTTKRDTVIVKLEEMDYKYPEDILKVLSEELKKYNIPTKISNSSISILGNYKQQLLAKDLIDKRTKNFANIYIGCLKKLNGFDAVVIQDGVETPLDTFESIKVIKSGEDDNGVEDYTIIHKTHNGNKEYKIKTNESKVKIAKENLNIKLKLF